MTSVYLGLGSNVDPGKHLQLGIRELARRFGDLELSNVYRSKAVGFDGEDFLNLVVGLETASSARDIHCVIEDLHKLANRQRHERRYSPRTLDIDLLLYGEHIIEDGPIHVPRADILEYSFVLGPLAEIAPDLVHPQTGKRIADHWAEFDKEAQPLTLVEIDTRNALAEPGNSSPGITSRWTGPHPQR
jgi:2-amino-4-hydroxy-6-hydroxymethyldihydropteridine diphosphokinase